jgi:hypothetical protein
VDEVLALLKQVQAEQTQQNVNVLAAVAKLQSTVNSVVATQAEQTAMLAEIFDDVTPPNVGYVFFGVPVPK